MKSHTSYRLFLIIIFLIPFTAFSQLNSAEDIKGIWEGKLAFSGVELRIIFKVNEDDEGGLTASLDSPDQGAKDIKVDNVYFNNDTVRFDVKIIAGYYLGTLNKDSAKITGYWNQGTVSAPLELSKTDKIEEVSRPQEPKRPFPYTEEEITFENKEADVILSGTLTFPKSGGPFPAVILITGSGPQDRDETIMGHKPFLVVSDYLTRNGIAVLRYDDRGVGSSTGNFSAATTFDNASDVKAGIEFLKTRSEIDKKNIGLIGHSEGGLIAPMAANETNDAAFIILLAGPGITGEEILIRQTELISKSMGVSDEDIERTISLNKKIYEILKSDKDSAAAADGVKELYSNFIRQMTPEEKKAIEGQEEAMINQSAALITPWFRTFIKYNPRPALRKLKIPVLAIFGENDLQVPAEVNKYEVEKALKEGGNTKFEAVIMPKLNHLFQTSETGSPMEYAKIEETFSPDVLQLMSEWILKNASN
jgi:uncharacterized protein